MKKKHYREFLCKEYMYGFIGENKDNIKRYKFRKYYSQFKNMYYILEFILINENKKLILNRSNCKCGKLNIT